jgi:hypothetical protein
MYPNRKQSVPEKNNGLRKPGPQKKTGQQKPNPKKSNTNHKSKSKKRKPKTHKPQSKKEKKLAMALKAFSQVPLEAFLPPSEWFSPTQPT